MRRTNVIKEPYAAYRRKDVAPDYEFTRVGRGTLGGEYLRRFWQPFAFASELTDVPLAVRLLGEDLVAFRDGQGNYGLLERRCSHRGASLEYGKIVDRGIRCCYHGWQFDVDGRILDIPGHSSAVTKRLCHGAYPVRNYRGLLFAYMGPPDRRPDFPLYDVTEREPGCQTGRKTLAPCNWIQIRENETDPMHLSQLHCGLFGIQFTEVFGKIPTNLEWYETRLGVMYAGTFRWKDYIYLRTNDLVLPNMTRVAGVEDAEGETLLDARGGATNWVVPIDDTNSMTIGWYDKEPHIEIPGIDAYMDRQRRGGAKPMNPAGNMDTQTGNRSYAERQRAPGDWDAFVSQGPTTIHGREHLVASDRGVTIFRKMLKAGMKAVAAGNDPQNAVRANSQRVLQTHSRNTVLRIPPTSDEKKDRAGCTRVGRWLSDVLLSNDRPDGPHGVASAEALDAVRTRAVQLYRNGA
ncbi:MAG: Rieske 2Fe-2S domain-containing protein [Alphaproteobacteria bacterium]